jgi:hypothetical protein
MAKRKTVPKYIKDCIFDYVSRFLQDDIKSEVSYQISELFDKLSEKFATKAAQAELLDQLFKARIELSNEMQQNLVKTANAAYAIVIKHVEEDHFKMTRQETPKASDIDTQFKAAVDKFTREGEG